jgi:phenylpropionate dioxygenase-like ring-hydroxylating dioxygenase large terminal subunit
MSPPGTYRNRPEAIAALVREREIHKDCYIDDEVFALEMEHLFANTWVYVGHASQVPSPGDYYATTVADQPVVMVRHDDASVRVLYNRCAHKGVQLVPEGSGQTGKFFRCPYHAWAYKTDGSLLAIPLKRGYENTGFEHCEAQQGMAAVGAVHVYRDFVFCRLNPQGESFEAFFGESLSTLDNMVDRSPEGRLKVEGGVLRYLHRCNWKMLVDNQTDTCHPMVAHESSAGTAVKVWQAAPPGTPKPMAVELFAPFVSPYDFFEKMGIRVWANGHGHTGVADSIHAAYSPVPGYWEAMVAAYGEERAKHILGEVRHNTVYFPNIMVKGPIQTLRIFKPLAADRTLVESWTFRLVGAPDLLLERTLMYNRLINAPTSVVGHDDLEVYERSQAALRARGASWVNVARLYEPAERAQASVVATVTNGTSESQMRNQMRAWVKYMTMSMPGGGAGGAGDVLAAPAQGAVAAAAQAMPA